MQIGLTLEKRVEEAVAPSLEQLGYAIIRIRMINGDRANTLQVMLEKSDGQQVNIDDCQKASKQMSAVLDVENIISERYTLEVSSPGIDRPLTRLKDFETYKGQEAKLEVIEKINDARKFRGALAGVDGEDILINTNVVSLESPQDENTKINFNNIRSAKLVLTDELLAMHKNNNI